MTHCLPTSVFGPVKISWSQGNLQRPMAPRTTRGLKRLRAFKILDSRRDRLRQSKTVASVAWTLNRWDCLRPPSQSERFWTKCKTGSRRIIEWQDTRQSRCHGVRRDLVYHIANYVHTANDCRTKRDSLRPSWKRILRAYNLIMIRTH